MIPERMLSRVGSVAGLLLLVSCARATESEGTLATDEPTGHAGGGSGTGAGGSANTGGDGSGAGCPADKEAGNTCATAKNAGSVADDVDTPLVLEGALTTSDDEDWFTFETVDKPEGVGNRYHIEIAFKTATDEVVFDVLRAASCGTPSTTSSDLKAYTYCVDGQMTMPDGGLVGEQECGMYDGGAGTCGDHSSPYFVRVHAASTYKGGGSCGSYELHVTARGGQPCDFTQSCEGATQ